MISLQHKYDAFGTVVATVKSVCEVVFQFGLVFVIDETPRLAVGVRETRPSLELGALCRY